MRINIDKSPKLVEKNHCTGCAACANRCPLGCVAMLSDAEGFLYPKIDEKKCTGCNECARVCPAITPPKAELIEPAICLVQHKDSDIRMQSTSGGAFTAIAQAVLQEGGVVFGAAFEDDFSVRHRYVDDEKGLAAFRNSKYVQSDVGNAYQQAGCFLKEGRPVCFSGTPCQIHGLLAFLGGSHPQLVTVDVVCRAVPSPGGFKKYFTYIQQRCKNPISHVLFRDKGFYGYTHSQMAFYSDSKPLYHNGIESDPWLRMFFSNIGNRPSCYNCPHRENSHISDLTLWDAFNVGELVPNLHDNKGTTKVLANTRQGDAMLHRIAHLASVTRLPFEITEALLEEMVVSVAQPEAREQFMNALAKKPGNEVFTEYFPLTWKVRVERFIRRLGAKLGFYTYLKRLVARWR